MNTAKLRNDIKKKLDRWNERSLFTLKGTKWLTKSDMDTLLVCCDWYDRHGSLEGIALSPGVKQVLKSYGAALPGKF